MKTFNSRCKLEAPRKFLIKALDFTRKFGNRKVLLLSLHTHIHTPTSLSSPFDYVIKGESKKHILCANAGRKFLINIKFSTKNLNVTVDDGKFSVLRGARNRVGE